MSFITFQSANLGVQVGLTFRTGKLPAVTLAQSKILKIVVANLSTNQGIPVYTLLYQGSNGVEQLYVTANDPAVDKENSESLFYDAGFLHIPRNNNLLYAGRSRTAAFGAEVLINRSIISSTLQIGTTNGLPLYRIELDSTLGLLTTAYFVPSEIAYRASNPLTPVGTNQSVAVYYVDSITSEWKIKFTNVTTGITTTFNTGLSEAVGFEWTLNDRWDVTPYGGFQAVFESNTLNRTYIYMFDADGTLVDQVDGFGEGYAWGLLNYKYTYAVDRDEDGSLIKFFDGKNVRTYEFSGLCWIEPDIWSYADITKNGGIPFEVYSVDEDTTTDYYATPNGGLINVNAVNENGGAWINQNSEYIIRYYFDENGYYTKFEVLDEGLAVINTFYPPTETYNDYFDRVCYGLSGHWYFSMYNIDDSTVPYLFVGFNSDTQTFQSFTHDDDNYDHNFNANDFDLYDDYSYKNNNFTVFYYGNSSGSPVGGFNQYESSELYTFTHAGGLVTYTFPADSYICTSDALWYGDTPLLQWFADGDEFVSIAYISNGEWVTQLTDIPLSGPSAITNGSSYAFADLVITVNDTEDSTSLWKIYSCDSEGVNLETTRTNSLLYSWNIDGGTICLVDSNYNDSWAYAAGSKTLMGPAPLSGENPTQLLTNDAFAGWPAPDWGYISNGKQIVAEVADAGPIAFYIITQDSTDWVKIANTFSDQGVWNWEKGVDCVLFKTTATNGNVYFFLYDAITGSCLSYYISDLTEITWDFVGDRLLYQEDTGTATQLVVLCKNGTSTEVAASGTYSSAFNDAAWSWD